MFYACIKRICDLLIGLVGLIFLIPIALLVKIAYVLTGDFYPIFYTQKRIGKNGKVFRIYKFRSMIPDADKALEKLLQQKKYRAEWERYQKLDQDPRITKVGKFVRKSSLDEFPQFLNVLFGQMSLVGPRPLVPGEIEAHGGNAQKYQSVKPGVTGYWAMRVRSNNASDYAERLKLEYFYVENQSLVLDLKIFFKTFGIILKHNGGAK